MPAAHAAATIQQRAPRAARLLFIRCSSFCVARSRAPTIIAAAPPRGVLPDATAFAIPAHDPAPPAIDVPADARDELVLLAVAMARPGVAESDVEDTSPSMPPRFHALNVDVADSHAASLRQAPLQLG